MVIKKEINDIKKEVEQLNEKIKVVKQVLNTEMYIKNSKLKQDNKRMKKIFYFQGLAFLVFLLSMIILKFDYFFGLIIFMVSVFCWSISAGLSLFFE